MTTLKDILCTSANRQKVISDTTRLVDDEVRAKSGISGLAIKAGYKTINAVKPTLVRDAVDNLLDRFVDKLEPSYEAWVAGGKNGTFGGYLSSRSKETANALLAVTDDRARNVDNQTIKKTYQKLRPQGEKNVEAAIPGLGRTLDRYVT